MAGLCEDLNLESQTSDTSPLLMGQQPSVQQEHVVTIRPDTDSSLTSSSVESGVLFRSLNSPSVPQEGVPTGMRFFSCLHAVLCNKSGILGARTSMFRNLKSLFVVN